MSLQKNIPVSYCQNIPIEQLGLCVAHSSENRRRYTKAQDIEQLAVRICKNNGKGITFNDLLTFELAMSKGQAQMTLKYCLKKQVLFTMSNHKPQQYYPTCLRADILKNKFSKNIPIGVTEPGFSNIGNFSINDTNGLSSNNKNCSVCDHCIVLQPLEVHVLPLLPSAPLYIHKMQFKLRIKREYYNDITISANIWNSGKKHEEIIGGTLVKYQLYSNGTVMVFTENSNNPFKIEDETDRSRLMGFFGQLRDRLIILLRDEHERVVPDIMEWQLTQFDINKDVKVSDWFQYTGLKIQVKHWDHIFRIYIKSMVNDTVCRVESSSIAPNKESSVIETINNIFNPTERLEKQIEQINRKLDLVFTSFCPAFGNGQMLLENMPASKATFFDKEHGADNNVPQ
jgi:hypothetical protein